jgi:hypothetical protein
LIVALYSTEAYVGRTDCKNRISLSLLTVYWHTLSLSIAMFCPTCYVGSGESVLSSIFSLITAFGVALFTSALFLVSLL